MQKCARGRFTWVELAGSVGGSPVPGQAGLGTGGKCSGKEQAGSSHAKTAHPWDHALFLLLLLCKV